MADQGRTFKEEYTPKTPSPHHTGKTTWLQAEKASKGATTTELANKRLRQHTATSLPKHIKGPTTSHQATFYHTQKLVDPFPPRNTTQDLDMELRGRMNSRYHRPTRPVDRLKYMQDDVCTESYQPILYPEHFLISLPVDKIESICYAMAD